MRVEVEREQTERKKIWYNWLHFKFLYCKIWRPSRLGNLEGKKKERKKPIAVTCSYITCYFSLQIPFFSCLYFCPNHSIPACTDLMYSAQKGELIKQIPFPTKGELYFKRFTFKWEASCMHGMYFMYAHKKYTTVAKMQIKSLKNLTFF